MASSPVVPLRRYTRFKENLLWNWVPGLASAVSDSTTHRYLRSFLHLWNTKYPVPRRRKMQHATYLRKVEEREQILTVELFRRLELWRQQRARYGDHLGAPHHTSAPMELQSTFSPDSSPKFDAINAHACDINNLQSPTDTEVNALFDDSDLQYTATSTSSDFLDFYIPPYESSAPDWYPMEPDGVNTALTQTFYESGSMGSSELTVSLDQISAPSALAVSLDQISAPSALAVSPDQISTPPALTVSPDQIFAPSAHGALLGRVSTPEPRQSRTVCSSVAANAETIEILLKWIEALKKTLSDQHREAGCEICYGAV